MQKGAISVYVVVVGCGRVGSQLATFLSEEGHDVAIIDRNVDAFKRLGSTFNGLSIEGLGFDKDILVEAGIEKTDVFAAVTDLDNTNMMAVEVATKIFDVPRAIARLYNPTRSLTYEKLGLEYICGTVMLAEKMLETIIAPNIDILATVGNFYIIRVLANESFVGKTISQVDRENDAKIITIVRRMKNVFCEPTTEIKRNDQLIMIIKKSSLPQIEKVAKPGASK
ncbi:MAG: TrkA family potassium uptake protein [Actinomycetia bacterium]|nr:TrkA family potassium uptake protein [Actinomycetes bacterium]